MFTSLISGYVGYMAGSSKDEQLQKLTIDFNNSTKNGDLIIEIKMLKQLREKNTELQSAKEASEAKKLVNTLSDKNLKAEEKLSQLDKSINEGINLSV